MAACGTGAAAAPTLALTLRWLLLWLVALAKLANSYELPGTPILVGGPTSDRSYVSASPQLVNEEANDFFTTNTNINLMLTSTAIDLGALGEGNSDSSRTQATRYQVSDLDSTLLSPIGAQFTTKLATIIRTRESLDSGASFINYTLVTSLNACLVECWITDSCDTLIYQESPVDFNNHLPTLGSFSASFSPPSIPHNNHKRHRPKSRDKLESESQEKQPHLQASLHHSTTTTQYRHSHQRHSTKQPIRHHRSHQQQQITSDSSNYVDYSEFTQPKNILNPEGGSSEEEHKQRSKLEKNPDQLLDLPQTLTDGGSGFFVCYLFQCAKQDGFKCQFSPHNYYISSTKLTSRRDDNHLSSSSENLQQQAAAAADAFGEAALDTHTEPTVTLKTSHTLNQQQQQPVRYSSIVEQANQHHWLNRHDSHIASIRIGGHEELAHLGGVNSAIIAILMGIGVTGVLMIIVGHKMKSIRKRIAHKRRRALPTDHASAPVDLLTSNSAATLLMTF